MAVVASAVAIRLQGPHRAPSRHPGLAAPVPPSDAALADWAVKIRPNHLVKGPPRPGDWLANQHEDGQTFAQYRSSDPYRPNGVQTTIYVVPVGPMNEAQQELFDAAAEALALFYSVPVERLEPISIEALPPAARRMNQDRPQVLTRAVLDLLAVRAPADALAVVGLTRTDLWPGEDWNFVFGEADRERHVGIWSTARLVRHLDEEPDVVRRVVGVAVHETGHLLGIDHCIAFECGMNGANGIFEGDRLPVAFCSEDEQKVWWATGADPVPRYRKLVEFAHRRHLPREEQDWAADLASLLGDGGLAGGAYDGGTAAGDGGGETGR